VKRKEEGCIEAKRKEGVMKRNKNNEGENKKK
jgi:hypothetical protein